MNVCAGFDCWSCWGGAHVEIFCVWFFSWIVKQKPNQQFKPQHSFSQWMKSLNGKASSPPKSPANLSYQRKHSNSSKQRCVQQPADDSEHWVSAVQYPHAHTSHIPHMHQQQNQNPAQAWSSTQNNGPNLTWNPNTTSLHAHQPNAAAGYLYGKWTPDRWTTVLWGKTMCQTPL